MSVLKFQLPVEGSYVAEYHIATPRKRGGFRAYQRLAGVDSGDEDAGGGYAPSEDEDEVDAAGSTERIAAAAAPPAKRAKGGAGPFLHRNVAKGKRTSKRKRGK